MKNNKLFFSSFTHPFTLFRQNVWNPKSLEYVVPNILSRPKTQAPILNLAIFKIRKLV